MAVTPQAPYRVVVTGIGAITPVGSGADGLWAGVKRGESAVRALTRFDPSPFRSHLAAEVDDFDPFDYLETKRAKRLDRYSQFAVAASVQAVDDAGLARDGLPEGMGCYLGSALGGVAFAEEQHNAYVQGGARAVDPSLALAVFGGAAPCNVAIDLGLRGPSLSSSNSCASGANAIGEAFRLIRSGTVETMLAGGAEVPLSPLSYGAFALIRAMSTANDSPSRASRPFDAGRDGFVMGEGAAMLVLERLDAAQRRGARIYAEILGYATTNDAYNMLAPRPDGSEAARSVSLALADAGRPPSAVDYVNAHASATPIGDRAEAAALRTALGDYAPGVPVSATKGLYGHPLGAAGAIEAAISALAITHRFLPGTTNLEEPDADAGLCFVGPAGLAASPQTVLSTSFGLFKISAAIPVCPRPALFEISVSPRAPFSTAARISPWATPTSPKPPTMTVIPSFSPASASPAELAILSIIRRPGSPARRLPRVQRK